MWTKLTGLVPHWVLNAVIGGLAGALNLFLFLGSLDGGFSVTVAIAVAYLLTAATNCYLWIRLLFQNQLYTTKDLLMYATVAGLWGALDLGSTQILWTMSQSASMAKAGSFAMMLFFNFLSRKTHAAKYSPYGPVFWRKRERRRRRTESLGYSFT